ncbi:MAG: futalosine hydrolase [Micromonosporaceae bacterium]|nr:futalosine hydrolase [Micromonosporaceae bacterium]
MGGYGKVLVVTAVEAERLAVLSGLHDHKTPPVAEVVAVGVGAAAAAAGTARLLALAECSGAPFEAVLCAGIAGGFPDRIGIGGMTIASASTAADAGANSPDGFHSLGELGLGPSAIPSDPVLVAALRLAVPAAVVGPVLTVATATGTQAGADALRARYPEAVAEAMEGYGVALAAEQTGAAFAEVRAVSNPIGPRDRAAWRVPQALRALAAAFAAL